MSRMLVLAAVIVPLLVVGVLFGAAAWSRRPAEAALVNGKLRPCPPKPNCVCSDGADGEAAIAPFSFPGDPEEAFGSLLAFLDGEMDAEEITEQGNYAHLVLHTPLLRFADDLELRLDPEARVIHVRSGSRVGHSDLGANRDRVEAIRSAWTPPPRPPLGSGNDEGN